MGSVMESQAQVASPPDELVEIELAARNLVSAASTMVMKHYNRPTEVEFKDKRKSDPVTDADREVEDFVTRAVAERFPDHAVLGEEGQDPARGVAYEWIVDPLDGTLNFVNGLPCFAVSVGVLYKGQPIVGAIALPTTGEVVHARLGGGAFQDGEAITVRDVARPRPDLLACLSPGHHWAFKTTPALLRRLGDSRSFGSIAYELGLVASGSVGYAAFRAPKIWDVAGGALIVTEAGGSVLVFDRVAREWRELRAFEPFPARDPSKPESLRNWSLPVLAGPPQLVRTIAPHLRPRTAPPRLARLLSKAAGRYRT